MNLKLPTTLKPLTHIYNGIGEGGGELNVLRHWYQDARNAQPDAPIFYAHQTREGSIPDEWHTDILFPSIAPVSVMQQRIEADNAKFRVVPMLLQKSHAPDDEDGLQWTFIHHGKPRFGLIALMGYLPADATLFVKLLSLDDVELEMRFASWLSHYIVYEELAAIRIAHTSSPLLMGMEELMHRHAEGSYPLAGERKCIPIPAEDVAIYVSNEAGDSVEPVPPNQLLTAWDYCYDILQWNARIEPKYKLAPFFTLREACLIADWLRVAQADVPPDRGARPACLSFLRGCLLEQQDGTLENRFFKRWHIETAAAETLITYLDNLSSQDFKELFDKLKAFVAVPSHTTLLDAEQPPALKVPLFNAGLLLRGQRDNRIYTNKDGYGIIIPILSNGRVDSGYLRMDNNSGEKRMYALTLQEASLTVDALNGVRYTEGLTKKTHLYLSIRDADAIDNLKTKWGLDSAAFQMFMVKLSEISNNAASECLNRAEAFWNASPHTDIEAGLREAGLLEAFLDTDLGAPLSEKLPDGSERIHATEETRRVSVSLTPLQEITDTSQERTCPATPSDDT